VPNIGLNKWISTTKSSFTQNVLLISSLDAGKAIMLRIIRVFELPTGSQIEWDFANLSADELNNLYQF
jgi:hypothetical protein